jgi:hypothetical protein
MSAYARKYYAGNGHGMRVGVECRPGALHRHEGHLKDQAAAEIVGLPKNSTILPDYQRIRQRGRPPSRAGQPPPSTDHAALLP